MKVRYLPVAHVVWVGTLRGEGDAAYRDIEIQCPFDCGEETHPGFWLAAHTTPGVQMAPCGLGTYVVQAPPPTMPVPDVCLRPTRDSRQCRKKVRHRGQPCHLHRTAHHDD